MKDGRDQATDPRDDGRDKISSNRNPILIKLLFAKEPTSPKPKCGGAPCQAQGALVVEASPPARTSLPTVALLGAEKGDGRTNTRAGWAGRTQSTHQDPSISESHARRLMATSIPTSSERRDMRRGLATWAQICLAKRFVGVCDYGCVPLSARDRPAQDGTSNRKNTHAVGCAMCADCPPEPLSADNGFLGSRTLPMARAGPRAPSPATKTKRARLSAEAAPSETLRSV